MLDKELHVCKAPSFTLKLSASAVNQGSKVAKEKVGSSQWQILPFSNAADILKLWSSGMIKGVQYSFVKYSVCVCVLGDNVGRFTWSRTELKIHFRLAIGTACVSSFIWSQL